MIYKDAPPSATPTEDMSFIFIVCEMGGPTRLKYSSYTIEEKFRGD